MVKTLQRTLKNITGNHKTHLDVVSLKLPFDRLNLLNWSFWGRSPKPYYIKFTSTFHLRCLHKWNLKDFLDSVSMKRWGLSSVINNKESSTHSHGWNPWFIYLSLYKLNKVNLVKKCTSSWNHNAFWFAYPVYFRLELRKNWVKVKFSALRKF